MSPQLERGGPPGAVYRCSSNGWMTTELFTEWMQHFAEQSNASVNNPVLLIMDNHSSHISLQTYLLCKQSGIHIVSIPPHTSHRLQPLDLTFFGPLKCALNKECDLFMKCHAAEKITPYDVPGLFNKAYSRVASVEKAARGFQCAGIWPLNPDVFDDDDFMAAENLQQRETQTENNTLPVADEDNESSSRPDQFAQGTSGIDMTTVSNNPTPSASERPKSCTKITLPDRQMSSAPNNSTTTEPATPKSSTTISVAEISPIPGPSNISRTISRRKPNKMRSQILTASPLKEQLEEAERRRSLKNCEGKTIPKRKVTKRSETNSSKKRKRPRKILSESSSDEDGIDETNICDDDELDDLEPMSGDICCICGEFGRNNELWFRCVCCSQWAHEECSGADTPDNYKCDYCVKKL
ncbi:hypothetical protein ANN_18169 [Periplaneta americana]|uniref:DDE-1 domain-containing protein n=1 Tax=Periplaneta americana TaxID=6978 RepID=A0ABQ8SN08_PERAM|nr:hypothetical protein ANN_18169 [Periplaneta americana]